MRWSASVSENPRSMVPIQETGFGAGMQRLFCWVNDLKLAGSDWVKSGGSPYVKSDTIPVSGTNTIDKIKNNSP